MMTSETRLTIHDAPDGGECVIVLREPLLNYVVYDSLRADLDAPIGERLERGVPRFVIDLSAVEAIDSCGLGVLIGVKKRVSRQQGEVILRGLSPICRSLLELTKLDRVFEIEETK